MKLCSVELLDEMIIEITVNFHCLLLFVPNDKGILPPISGDVHPHLDKWVSIALRERSSWQY